MIILIALWTIASGLSAQEATKYRFSILGEDSTMFEDVILTGLRDSSILISTAYEKVNKLVLVEHPFKEVEVRTINSLVFDKKHKEGGVKGAGIGLLCGVIPVFLLNESDRKLGAPTSNGLYLPAGLIGMGIGALVGHLAQNKNPDILYVKGNQKAYMDQKEYLEKYVFRY